MNKKYKALIKDTFIFAIGGIGSKVILFLLVPLYTNYLTTEEYGTADLIFTLSQLIIPFVSLVIFDAVLRFALSESEKKEDVLLCSLAVFSVGSIVTVLITPFIGLYETVSPWKWHLCIYIIINIFMSIELSYIKAKGYNKLYSFVSILQTLSMALTNILFIVIIPLGVDGYVLANIIGNSIAAILIFFLAKIYSDIFKAKFSLSLLKKMLIYSTPLILNNLSWWIIFSANKIMVELILGASVLGIYTVATKIPSLINVFISIFQQSWGISTVRELESSNDSKFYSSVFDIYSFFAFGLSIFLILIIKPLMTVYVGESFIESWIYIPILLASATFSALASYFGALHSALKKSFNGMVTTLIAALCNILVSIILLNYIGLWGAIIGTFSAYVILAITRIFDVLRYIKIDLDYKLLAVNSLILISQAISVSLKLNIYIVSSIAIILFVIFNFKLIRNLFEKIKARKNEKNDV